MSANQNAVRFLALSLVLATGACGSAPRTRASNTQLPPEAQFDGRSIYLNIVPDRHASSHVISGTPERVWFALAAIYEELGITVTHVSVGSRTLGNRNFTTRRQLGGTPLSQYLDCGVGFSGPVANQNRITIDILTQLKAAGPDSVDVQTVLAAIASPVEGTSNNPFPCSSRGTLEQSIATRIQIRIAS